MANKKFNFKTPLLDNNGQEVTENGKLLIISDILSDTIMSSRITEKSISLKFFSYGLELKKSGVLELDKVDEDKLKDWVFENPNISVLGVGRINEVFENPVK